MLFFSRFMNQYFLLIACLQLWPLITPVNPASTWGPLLFIFAVSATKEAWDDYNRYVSDKKANEKQVWVVKKGVKKHVCYYIFWTDVLFHALFLCSSFLEPKYFKILDRSQADLLFHAFLAQHFVIQKFLFTQWYCCFNWGRIWYSHNAKWFDPELWKKCLSRCTEC